MFAVTGVTGKVGGAVARALLESGLPVRAIVRDAAKGRVWADRGCEIAVADLGAGEPLIEAFSGADGVFAMLPPIFDPKPGFPEARSMIAVLRHALATAKPAYVVALSTIGADVERPNLLNQLRLLEQSLIDLPMSVAFLRAAWFMDNAVGDLKAAQETGVIHSQLQPLERRFPMIAAEEVGRTAAALLQESSRIHGVVELEAVDRVSPNDIAKAFARTLGRPVKAEAVPRASWEAIFRADGMNNPVPRIQMIDGFNEGWIDFPQSGAAARKGHLTIGDVIGALAES